ncbi:hypothetical protein NDU88_001884 [Pleurodeles waltl]|uniref:Uncharacterized protein n=1 Tax=Pleurodeles waltl TaxID=8319 RepID=A0AAV7RCH0_PLEWA|nr:hypothetical protein NDU88_001884 [Pleurodeles waltl]
MQVEASRRRGEQGDCTLADQLITCRTLGVERKQSGSWCRELRGQEAGCQPLLAPLARLVGCNCAAPVPSAVVLRYQLGVLSGSRLTAVLPTSH